MKHLSINENNIGGLIVILISFLCVGGAAALLYSRITKDVPRFVSKELPVRNESTLEVESVELVLYDTATEKMYPIEMHGENLWVSIDNDKHMAPAAEWEQPPTPVPGQEGE